MSNAAADEARAQAIEAVRAGKLEEGARALQVLATLEPGSADVWVNLASIERDLGQLQPAADHFRRGLDLLEAQPETHGDVVARTATALGATLQSLELTDEAVQAFRRAAAADPRAPQPWAGLASLFARAGELEQADKAAMRYCLAAVSLLSEKEHIGAVRRFQKAMKEAATVDGLRLVAATREAYVKAFDDFAATLPPDVRFEEEPHRRDATGKLVPALAHPHRPFSRVRFDAIHPATGQRWMIHDTPTYGYPRDCPAAAEGFFSIPLDVGCSFRTLIATRTAWDYFFVRLRFVNGMRPGTMERTEQILGEWYLRGCTGVFSDQGRGFFHFLSEPFAIGADGLRYEIDLGRSRFEAVIGLLDALERLHEQEPLEVVVLGDGLLPPRAG